jgi:hypothetical protein
MLSVSEPSVSLRAAVIGNAKVELDATSKVLFESITALSIIIDVDGDDLSVVNLSVVSSDVDNVTLTDNNNGTWTLIPKANFSGEITFNYQISDGYELALAKSCAEVMVKLWSSFVESDTSARLIALWL